MKTLDTKNKTRSLIYRLVCFLFLWIQAISSFSEGTKEIQPASGDVGMLVLDAGWSNFAQYGCAPEERLQIRICNPNEVIYFGFTYLGNNKTVEYRIKNQAGTVVMGPANLPTTGAGYITSFNRAVAGPTPIAGGTGYTPLSFTAPTTGDYYIEFRIISGGPRIEFDYFDITVANAAGNTAIPGRVWSKSWMLSTGNYGVPFKGKMYVYADDSIVTSLDFNGMEPYVFVLNANKTGTNNTGNPALDRMSQRGKATYPQYKVFLNNPDEACYPTGHFGQITAPSTVSGCPPSNFCVNVFVDRMGFAQILFELNGIPGYQAGTRDRMISATINPPSGCIPWDGKDGLGNFVTTGATITTNVEFYNGLTNIPLYDVERNPLGYKVALVRPGGTVSKLFWDDTNIPGGSPNLNGTTSPSHTWDWTCCNNSANDYGNTNTINTWWYADSTRNSSSNIVPPAIIASADTRPTGGVGGKKDSLICGSVTSYLLSGQVLNANGGVWSTTGTGTFSNTSDLHGSYNITAADKAAGSVKIILTTTGNGACPAIRDTLTLRFQPVPTANAGAGATVCANNPAVKLNGSFSNATGAFWSSAGGGTFSPSNTVMNATYTPSASEISAGVATLTLTTTGNNKCSAAISPTPTSIIIQPSPTVNPGTAQTVCQNSPAITLAGAVTNATSQTWSAAGGGTFSPNNSTLNATFTPTAAQISAGTVTLTLTATKAGCNSVSGNVTMTISPSPTANAGSNLSMCYNTPSVGLSGSVTNATSFAWTGGGGTFTPNNTTLNASYSPTTAEKNAGSFVLTLTANRAGCTSATSNVTITVTPAPVVNAGNDGTVCANRAQYNLSGTSSTGSGTWTGLGTFIPNANNLNATYTPNASEIGSGVAAIILTSTNNGNCAPVKDTILLFITPAPINNAGPDQSVCSNNPTVILAGIASGSSSNVWSGGNGTFSPNTNTLKASYTPSTNEITSGSVTLTLTSNRATCNAVTDNITINFTPTPTINAGANQNICFNNPTVTLNGTVTVATGGIWSGGAGTFTSGNALSTTYTPTADELANGSITLTITSTGNGNCNAVVDQMSISVKQAPKVVAGNPQTTCANNPTVSLQGSVVGASGGKWSGGNGTYTPNANSLKTDYTPTPGEISSGSVNLTLTTIGNGNCLPVEDKVKITYELAPTVNPVADKSICADNPVIHLNGAVTQANGGTWSGGSGTFTPNNNSLTATYIPTTAEINAGGVTLTLTTTGNALNCNPESFNVTIPILPQPVADAGSDQIICSAASNVSLNGTITAATGGIWTTSGTGTFSPNATTLNAAYVPSAADKTSGSVTLTLTTTGMAPCNAVNDKMVISFTGVPSISAGPDQIVCTNAFPIQLNGSGSPAKWSGGTGTFSNISLLNPTYTPSAAEINSKTVTLTLTTNPSGACPTVSDQVTITIPPAPVADAGADQTMCGNASSVTLNGAVANANGGFWTTSGTGSFSPNNKKLNATYIPSALDKTNGIVTLTLETTGNGACGSATDQMTLIIQPAIIVTAGPDQNICSNTGGFTLNGASVQNAGGIIWSSNGSGSFAPNTTTINPVYTPSAADISAGTITLTISTTGNGICPVQTDAVTYTIKTAPVINAGTDQTICSTTGNITLNGTVAAGFGVQWSSTGTGTFTPNSTTVNATYTPSAADITAGTVTFTIASTGNGVCAQTTDQMVLTINPKPTVNAGNDQTVCGDVASVNLTGVTTVVSGGTWTTSGDGNFSNANALNTNYIPGANDITNGIVTLTLTSNTNGVCTSANDQVVVNITPVPTVNAGPDRSICKNNSSVNLSGSVTIASGGIWSGGAGTFNPSNTSLNAIYTPTAAELTAGTVTLTLTTTGNGLCNAKTDQVVINFTNAPTVNAGNDMTICADSTGIQLNGNFTIATGATWTSSGTGNFFPNNTVANATYVPSLSDRTSGTVTFTYSTTGNGNCNAVIDQAILTITPAPTVNAGSDQTVCANNSVISVTGTSTVASGVLWATSGTGTFGNANNLTTNYTPSALDIAAGNVTITITTTGNGSCKPVTDQLIMTINPAPTVNAGPDQTVCANNSVVTLNGNFTIATGASWTSSGNGVFNPNNTTLNATYTPSPADIANGNVTLTLTSTGNGLCNAVNDQMVITITPAPTINAGSDKKVCADVKSISLNGTATVATGGIWTSNGSGIFTPNAATLTASYQPSAADTAAKSVRLILTTTGFGNCLAVKDTMFISFDPKPIVNAGPDQSLCSNIEFVDLSGVVQNATGGIWSSSGSGFFTPNANSIITQYIPTGAETNGGSITLTLTSTGNGTCNSVSDQVIVKLQPIPSANAGPDQTICANVGTININGSITNATSGSWSSSGDGTFANNNALSTTYTPSANDIATGSVVLTLTTSGSGICNSSSDQLKITFTPAPIASAGNDQTICANNAQVSLVGVVTVAAGGIWTTNGSGSFANVNALSTTYSPSAADITAGTVTLTLTTTGNGSCNQVQDQLIVTITPAPTVNPGSPVTICANSTATLNGVVTGAAGGVWTTASGTGTFTPDANTLNAVFTPSASQIANGRANLTLTTTGNGNCLAVSASVLITIQPIPTVNAGPDASVCTGTPSIGLSGTVTNVPGGTWSTSGGGTFTPNANTLNAAYIPSAAENVNGNSVTLTLTTTGNGSCSAVADQMTITFKTTPVNAGADKTVCSNSLPVQLNGSGSGVWSGGLGTFSNPNSLNTTYTPAPSEIPSTVTLTLTGSAVGACIPSVDNIIITIKDGPVATAGTNQSICSNNGIVNVNGTVNHAGGGIWKTEGSGTFNNPNSLSATYTASPADTLAGSIKLTLITTGNGICPADSSNINITFTPSPKVNAGIDQASCANAGPVTLNGNVTVAAGGTWTTNGSGTFGNANSTSTTYTPSAADKAAGSVTLKLTSNAVNNCNAVSDNLVISIGSLPTADAGNDQTLCSDASGVNLNGAVTIAGGGQWTSNGTGIFTPNNTTLNATYVPSANDIAANNLTLTLTTIGNGNCNAVSNDMVVKFTPIPTIDAGANQTVCSDITSTSIAATVNVATNASWISSGTGTFANSNNSNTSYTPSAADKAAGSVILTATTTGNGTCNAYSDFLTIFFTPTPTINAGADQSVCKDVTSLDLSAIATVASGGTWSTAGNGTFGNVNSLATTYIPSATDKSNGSVTLTVTSSGNGTCNAVSDQMTISFTNSPVVTASQDRNICSDKDSVHVTGTFTISTGIIWSSSGSGTFSPDATSANATYYPSVADRSLANITLTMTTTGNGTCNPASAQTVLTLSPKPIVAAGNDINICAGQSNAILNGTVTNASGGIWTSTGTGTFNNANSLNTIYVPSTNDFTNGGVLLTLTSTGNGVCTAVADVVSVNIIPSPIAIVNAGLDMILCSDIKDINLSGFISNAGGGLWSTAATGTFNPDNSTMEGKFIPSPADIASGSIIINLASTNNGICNSVSDNMLVTFTPAPTVTATGPAAICGDMAGVIPVNGSFTVATGAIWTSGGTGAFAPSISTTNPTYYPSAEDRSIGKVGLTYTTTGNGTCQPVSKTILVNITKPPVINAGNDISICASNTAININALVSVATGGTWTTSGTGSFGNSNALNTVYNPSSADTSNKEINLIVTSTGNGTCTPVSDAVKISFVPVPISNAGANRTICASTTLINITGAVYHATSGIWTTSGSGSFANQNGLSASYMPSPNDIANGSVTLSLETTGSGKCTSVSDQVVITLQPVPVVTTGTVMICELELGSPLAGDVTNAAGGVWSTNGTGVFAPDNTDLNAVYYPSPADAAKGKVLITLTSSGNGECSAISQTSELIIDPMPFANAGKDRFTCPGGSITLAAETQPGLRYNWVLSGGTIIGGGPTITVSPSAKTDYVLAVTNAKGCTSTDTLTVDIFTLPTINLASNYCLSNSLIIDGIPTPQPTVPGIYTWTLDGKFVPDNNTPVISPIDPGQYILTFSYENCMASDNTEVNPMPKLIGGFIKDCIGKSTDVTVLSNGNGYIYNWSTGQNGTDLNTVNINVVADTSYYVATVTNPATTCSNKDSVRVIGIPTPILNLTDMATCEGLSHVLNGRPANIANLDSLYPEYIWMKNNNPFITNVDNITVTTSGLYKEILTIGQCIAKDSAQIDFHSNPITTLPGYTKFCKPDDNKVIIDAGPGANQIYVWTAPQGVILDSANTQTITVRTEGTYFVTVTNQFNCTTKDSIFVDDLCGPRTDGPNAIIPGDPNNGTFRIYGNYFKNYKLMIFNRWGEVIFQSTNQMEGWDGSYLGQPMPIGVYPYIVTYDSEDPAINEHYKKEGSVTIIR